MKLMRHPKCTGGGLSPILTEGLVLIKLPVTVTPIVAAGNRESDRGVTYRMSRLLTECCILKWQLTLKIGKIGLQRMVSMQT